MKEELGTSNVENNRYWFEEFKKYGDTSNGVIYIELKDKIDETKK